MKVYGIYIQYNASYRFDASQDLRIYSSEQDRDIEYENIIPIIEEKMIGIVVAIHKFEKEIL